MIEDNLKGYASSQIDKALSYNEGMRQGYIQSKEEVKQEQMNGEPIAWIFEYELPKRYPYEEMFPYSKVDVVRMFPIFGPSSKKEQASSNNEVLLQYPKEDVEWQKQQMEHAQQLNAEALKQEQVEPVGKFAKFTDGIWREVTDGSAGVPLYTTPQTKEWVGLTGEEIWEACMESPVELDCSADELYVISRIIEAKLKEKNI